MSNEAQQEREAQLDSEGMDRGISFLGLTWASEASLIGSGWLFGALTAVTIAGPSAIIAWVVATIIVGVLALIHAELGGLFPVSGGTSRFPHYAFGSFAGATFGWMSYLQAAAVAPIEVLAAIEYFSTVGFAQHWYNGTKLTGVGIVVAIILMGLFTFVNLVGVRWLARVNNSLTWWKVLVPVLTIIVFIGWRFHGSNFSAGGGFFVHGAAVKSILIAIPNGGIVFSLLGFEQAVQLGGEARNPSDVPKAVILSLVIGATIYILLQVAFIGAIQPSLLASCRHLGEPRADQQQRDDPGAERRTVPSGRGARRARLAGRDPPDRRDRLAERHRTDLPDLGLADPVRAVQERIHPADVRERLRPRPGAGDGDPPDRGRRADLPAAVPELGEAGGASSPRPRC